MHFCLLEFPKMKNGCCKRHHGYQLEKSLSKLQLDFPVTGLPDGDIWRLTDPREGSHQEGRVKLPNCWPNFYIKSPDHISSLHKNTKWQHLGGGAAGTKGSCCGWQWQTWHLRAGGQAIEIQARDIIKTRKYNEKDSKAKANATTI